MRTALVLICAAVTIAFNSCTQKDADIFVWVKGGNFTHTKSRFYNDKNVIVHDFHIGRYEVTQKEWTEIMGTNPSQFKGDNLPVETVSWYDCIVYCNKRSVHEGLYPYYHIDSVQKDPHNTNDLDDIKWTVTLDTAANGYRLPTEIEWEYAASGGNSSKSYAYNGSDSVDEVSWYWKNSGDKYLDGNWTWSTLVQNHNSTKAVGGKKPNELGLYDMSGNVREWCWDWYEGGGTENPQGKVWKGGGWIGADFCCAPAFRAGHQANGKGPDQGFRVVKR